MRLLKWVTGLLFAAACALALPSLWTGFAEAVAALYRTPQFWPMVAGIVPGLWIGRWASHHATWWSTFEHELTHAVVGLPFGLIPYGFVVTRDRGGLVKQFCLPLPIFLLPVPLLGQHVSGLAPYAIPLFALAAALGVEFAEWWPYPLAAAGVVGFLVGYHLYSNLHELRTNASPRLFPNVEGNAAHTDIAQSGYLASAAIIPALWLGSHAIIAVIFARTGIPGLLYWGENVARGTWGTAEAVATYVSLIHR